HIDCVQPALCRVRAIGPVTDKTLFDAAIEATIIAGQARKPGILLGRGRSPDNRLAPGFLGRRRLRYNFRRNINHVRSYAAFAICVVRLRHSATVAVSPAARRRPQASSRMSSSSLACAASTVGGVVLRLLPSRNISSVPPMYI